jgi:predicted dehydrogenase
MKQHAILFSILSGILFVSCNIKQQQNESVVFTGKDGEIKLIILDPGHFHANLVQKSRMKQVNDSVFVYAPEGKELDQYLSGIASYNHRADEPTTWKLSTYTGPDFSELMVEERKGNVVILAGNNKQKTANILKSVEAGLNVLSDKPMAITENDFMLLEKAYTLAKDKDVMLYDIMTERYDMLNIIEKILLNDTALFGELDRGSTENPGVYMESVHHFYKEVSGKALVRPAWYYDVEQQGEGIADVTTHLIDIIHWKCFSEQPIYRENVKVLDAKHWATAISLDEFKKSTLLDTFPDYLSRYAQNSVLNIMANGTIHYRVNDVNVGIRVIWNYRAPVDGGDTHSSVFRGTKASLRTIQDKSHDFVKQLYIHKAEHISPDTFKSNLESVVRKIQEHYPFIYYTPLADGVYRIEIPVEHREGHEAHFRYVAEKFFSYLVERNMPEWEMINTLTKYYITTTAVAIANNVK